MRPALLGALLDAAAGALRGRDGVTVVRRPRMADAYVWVVAAEPALDWPAGTTEAAWFGARDTASKDSDRRRRGGASGHHLHHHGDDVEGDQQRAAGRAEHRGDRRHEAVAELAGHAERAVECPAPTGPRPSPGRRRHRVPRRQEPHRQGAHAPNRTSARSGRRSNRHDRHHRHRGAVPAKCRPQSASSGDDGSDDGCDGWPEPSPATVTPESAESGRNPGDSDGRDGRDGSSPSLSGAWGDV